MTDSPNTLLRLQRWFSDACDGDWEHGDGIRIATLDNPGWSLKVDLEASHLAGRQCAPVQLERTEHDWIRLRVEGETFVGFGGPGNLEELISRFLDWAANPQVRTER